MTESDCGCSSFYHLKHPGVARSTDMVHPDAIARGVRDRDYDPCPDGHGETYSSTGLFGFTEVCCVRCGYAIIDL